jgi:uncharacterized phage protein (TIGR01671 family)
MDIQLRVGIIKDGKFDHFNFHKLEVFGKSYSFGNYHFLGNYELKKPELFTGRNDDFGVKIFEGDICRVLYTDWGSKSSSDTRTLEQYLIDISSIGVVERVADKFEINFGKNRFDEFVYGSFDVGSHGKLKVIGNVHENAELLNVKPKNEPQCGVGG